MNTFPPDQSRRSIPIYSQIIPRNAKIFSNVIGDPLVAEDPDGADYPDLAAARASAVASAREIVAERLVAGGRLDGQRIEICSEEGDVLDTVYFAEVYWA